MLIDADAPSVRVGLRAFFLVITALIGFSGSQCLKARNKVALSRHGKIPTHYTTGWITESAFFRTLYHLRSVPAGAVMGMIMLLVTISIPVADLAVNGLVKNVRVQSRCDFGQGMVVNVNGPYSFDGPPWNGLPASVATQAQLASVHNGGRAGIYKKVNANFNFSAEAEDVIAGWTCSVVSDDLHFDGPATAEVVAEVIDTLLEKNYQYMPYAAEHGLSVADTYEHFVMWSASTSFAPFTVLASVELNVGQTTGMDIRTRQCSIPSTAADDIMTAMNTNWTLKDWIQVFQGRCYDGSGTPARDDVGTTIEQLLNTMLMVLGGNNFLLETPNESSDTTQGCVVTKTDVPNEIYLLIAIFALVFISIIAWWLKNVASLHLALRRSTSESLRAAFNMLPNGLTSWMLIGPRERALETRNTTAPTKRSHLKDWNVVLEQNVVRVLGPVGVDSVVEQNKEREFLDLEAQKNRPITRGY